VLALTDVVCCQSSGVVSVQEAVQLQVFCTHDTHVEPSCVDVVGPVNVSAWNFGGAYFGRKNDVILNWANDTGAPYTGPVEIDLETNRPLSPSCDLLLATPCTFNGVLVTKAAPTTNISLNVAPDFGATLSPSLLNTVTFPLTATSCASESILELPPDFVGDNLFLNFTGGFEVDCLSAYNVQLGSPSSSPGAFSPVSSPAASGR
jgi:hypothetical protein